MTGLLAGLEAGRREELLDDLNYLNLEEIRSFCDRHAIPYRIVAGERVTRDTDRKPVILRRVRHFLLTGEVLGATRLAAGIVRSGGPPDEYAFLTDLQRGTAGPDWKLERERKAGHFLSTLDTLTGPGA